MKTHLPVVLRKALLAAIVAVSACAYNQSFAAEYGEIVTAGQSLTVTGDEDVTVTTVSEAADNLTIRTESGDVKIEVVAAIPENSLEALSIESGGTVSIGESWGVLSGASITAVGDISIGAETSTNPETQLKINSETGVSTIDTKGNLIVKQGLDIQAAEGNAVIIRSDGEMNFSGIAPLLIGSDEKSEVLLQAGDTITMQNQHGTEIGKGVKLVTTGDESDVVIKTLGASQTNGIYGIIESTGKVSMTGSSNHIWNFSTEKNSVSAKTGIDIHATGQENSVQSYELSTETGGIQMIADEDAQYNYVSNANLSVTKSGNVEMQGGHVSVFDSELTTVAGSVKLEGKSAAVTNSTLRGTEDVIIAGNEEGSDDTGISTGISDADIDGKTITIGDAATATTIGSQVESDDKYTTLDASGMIAVNGSTVSVSDGTTITSTGGAVQIKASTRVHQNF